MDNTTTGSFVDTNEWVPIHTLSGFNACIEYFINRQGQVKSTKGNIERILTHSINEQGYPQVSLTQRIGRQKPKKVPVHKLVAFAFLGQPPTPYGRGAGCCVIHHKDEDPSNCCVDNLEWMTSSDHRLHHGATLFTSKTLETNKYSEAHKQSQREYQRTRRQDPAFLEQEKLQQRERRATRTHEQREAHLARERQRDAVRRKRKSQDPEKLAKKREYQRQWMANKRAEQKAVKIVESDN